MWTIPKLLRRTNFSLWTTNTLLSSSLQMLSKQNRSKNDHLFIIINKISNKQKKNHIMRNPQKVCNILQFDILITKICYLKTLKKISIIEWDNSMLLQYYKFNSGQSNVMGPNPLVYVWHKIESLSFHLRILRC